MTPKELLAFEEDIAQEFAAGKIHAPIHLSGGNEEQLIDIFKGINRDDWICTHWRSHYHCLLHGVPPEKVKTRIMMGHSMSLCFPEHRIFTSSIVGGIAPIATGIAWAIKQRGGKERVFVFLGDMSDRHGAVHVARQYARGHDLPIVWVVEDNEISVCSNTEETWGTERNGNKTIRYKYSLTRPHSGIGRWVRF